MDPITAAGLAGSIIGIIGGISKTVEIIGNIKDRPKAFFKVEENLPLVQSILKRARNNFENSDYSDEQEQVAQKILKDCEKKARDLRDIFIAIKAKCNEDKEAKTWTWSKARDWYRVALQNKRSHKVEKLMTAILEGMKQLAADRIFKLLDDVEKINIALQELQNVDASLDDSELDLTGISQINDNGSTAERPGLVSKLKFIMLARASHMFIWTHLISLKIRDLATSGLPDSEMLEEVSSFPKELNDVYQTLLDKMDQSRRQDAVSLLQLVYVATRPLTIAEVMAALGESADPKVLNELLNTMEDFEIGELVFEKSGLSGDGQTTLELVMQNKKNIEKTIKAERPEKHYQKFLVDLKCRQEDLEKAASMLMKFMEEWGDE
ncbi:hypothetical protein K4K51_003809 [Colletotrichum sp. SAR 10_75]|nr:hypothetical protein K4K51_003809 [Colletotrichum sp. SAR 10_75]